MITDEILSALSPSGRESFLPVLEEAVVVRIQNVVDYFYMGTDQEFWHVDTDFPNCAPPWKLAWLEWRHPKWCVSKECGRTDQAEMAGVSHGCLVAGSRLDDWTWILDMTFMSSKVIGAVIGESKLFLHEDGSPWAKKVGDGTDKRFMPAVISPLIAMRGDKSIEVAHEMVTGIFMYLILLSYCFCHCKNVRVDQTDVPKRLARRRAKKGKVSINSYHTIDIVPFKRSVASRGGDPNNIKRAIKICRGHFKDYRGASGLFGKHQGVYWWEMRVKSKPHKIVGSPAYTINPGVRR